MPRAQDTPCVHSQDATDSGVHCPMLLHLSAKLEPHTYSHPASPNDQRYRRTLSLPNRRLVSDPQRSNEQLGDRDADACDCRQSRCPRY